MVNDIPTSRASGLCCLPTKSGLAAAGWDVLIANSKIPKFRRLIDVTTSTTVSSGGLTDTSNWSIQFCLRRAFFLWCKIKKKSLFKSVLTLQSKVSAPYQSLADLVFPVIGGSWTPGSKEQGRPGPSPWRRNTGYGGCLVLIGPWWRNVSHCQWAGLSHSWSLSPKRKRR